MYHGKDQNEEKLSVTFLVVEKRNGNRVNNIVIRSPSWGVIEGAIRGLDADDWSALTLETPGETRMAIGGGAGRYRVQVLTGGGIQQLVDPSKTEEAVGLVIGGRGSRIPRRLLVNLRTVLKAARRFAETGELEKSLSWEDGSSVPAPEVANEP